MLHTKPRTMKLETLRIKSFVTNLDKSKVLTVKGGDTEDNTAILISLEQCKSTVEPFVPGSDYHVCIEEPSVPN